MTVIYSIAASLTGALPCARRSKQRTPVRMTPEPRRGAERNPSAMSETARRPSRMALYHRPHAEPDLCDWNSWTVVVRGRGRCADSPRSGPGGGCRPPPAGARRDAPRAGSPAGRDGCSQKRPQTAGDNRAGHRGPARHAVDNGRARDGAGAACRTGADEGRVGLEAAGQNLRHHSLDHVIEHRRGELAREPEHRPSGARRSAGIV